MPRHRYLLSHLLTTSGSTALGPAHLLLSESRTTLIPTRSLTALLPGRLRVLEARDPAHVAHAQLAAAAHEEWVVGSVAHCVEHLLAVACAVRRRVVVGTRARARARARASDAQGEGLPGVWRGVW